MTQHLHWSIYYCVNTILRHRIVRQINDECHNSWSPTSLMLTEDVFHLREEPNRDPVQSKCVLTACYFSHSGMKSSPVLSYSREQPFSSISPLPTNGGCCEAISSGTRHACHQYTVENAGNYRCLFEAHTQQNCISFEIISTIYLFFFFNNGQ